MKKETKWKLDPSRSVISFYIRHLMISSVKGSFTKFDASIHPLENDFTNVEIELHINVASISTGDDKRDECLRGSEFFDIKNHKQISFISDKMGISDDSGKRQLWGELTMKSVSKRIMLSVESGGIITDLLGKEKAGFKITGKINSADWGLQWTQTLESGGLMLSDEVDIICDIEFINMNQEELIADLDSRDDSYATPL
jgi:polyisoprenoid-binding protein YceI